MFFVESLLTSYNINITPLVLLDSKVYNKYKLPEAFYEYVIKNRNTYSATRAPRKLKKISKRAQDHLIPIMLGSYLDMHIRGPAAVLKEIRFWGGFIVNGSLCCYANFSTFDAMSLHAFTRGNECRVDWFFYLGEQGVSITFNGYVITCDYMGSTHPNWISLVELAIPYPEPVVASEYFELFNSILKTPYHVNAVENRIIMDAPHMFLKVLKRNEELNTKKLRNIFNEGTFYSSLSKNTDQTFTRQYTQTSLRSMIDGKGDKLPYILPQCTKQMNAKLQNSTAILPGDDINTIYCMLDVKDMKSAGETNTLTRSTILTQETDHMQVYNFLKGITLPKPEESSEILKHVVINGFLVCIWLDWTKETLLKIKHKFPFVVTKVYGEFVHVKTKANYAVRYCEADECFYSSAEQVYWKPVYSEYDRMSKITSGLGPYYYKTDASKNTVALNNIKGAISLYDSDVSKTILTNTLGTTSCMTMVENPDFTRFADISEELNDYEKNCGMDIVEYRKQIFQKYKSISNAKFETTNARTSKPTNYSVPRKMFQQLNMEIEGFVYVGKKIVKAPVAQTNNLLLSKYVRTVIGQPSQEYPGMDVICAFGNYKGLCVEDGIVLDKKLANSLPNIEHSMRITVSFIYPSSIDNRVVVNLNDNPNDDYLGTVICDLPAKAKHSASCCVKTEQIGGHYYNQVYLLTKGFKQYPNYSVTYSIHNTKVTLIIAGSTELPIRTGSKISNQQGQKNIVTSIQDLKPLYGYTKDGKKIHAQILYSDVSLIGRIAGGQMYEMLNSDQTAFSEDGLLLGKIKIYINSIDPYVNAKVFALKYDTYTHLNGGESQGLTHVGNVIRREPAINLTHKLVGMHGYTLG